MAISKIKDSDGTEHELLDNTHTLITLSTDSGTLSSTDLAKLKANPHKTIFNRGGYYYFAENLTSSAIWYYSCNVYYDSSKIIKRVISITTASGAYTKTDYTYTPPTVTVDSSISSTSTNPVRNSVIATELAKKMSCNTNNLSMYFAGDGTNTYPIKLSWTDDGSYTGGTINFPRKDGETVTLATTDDIQTYIDTAILGGSW